MAGLIDKRKRSREDDICDSTPLSKRINQLHLTNFEDAQAQHETTRHHAAAAATHFSHAVEGQASLVHGYGMHDLQHNIHINKHLMPPAIVPVVEQQQDHHHHHIYNPELNEAENPFYYIKNKLLHDLHFERIKRCAV